jgi:hypothetical protein
MRRMRPVMAAMLLFPFLTIACGKTIRSGSLLPVPQAQPAGGPVYAQVRRFGTAQSEWRLRWTDRQAMTGYTLDLHNRAGHPVVVPIGRTVMRAEPKRGPGRVSGRAVASGSGDLPSRLSVGDHPVRDLILSPGQGATIWVLFAQVEPPAAGAPSPEGSKTLIVLPVEGSDDLTIQLTDSTSSTQYSFDATRSGLTLLATSRYFTSPRLDMHWTPFGFGLWHVLGPFRLTIMLEGAIVQESAAADPDVRDVARWYALDLQWIPQDWVLGLYVAGDLVHGDLAGTSWRSEGPRFGASAGLVMTTAWIRGVPFTFRGGYTRMFDVPAARHGISLGLEVPIFFF